VRGAGAKGLHHAGSGVGVGSGEVVDVPGVQFTAQEAELGREDAGRGGEARAHEKQWRRRGSGMYEVLL
jgi:hypothetical protein